MGWFWKYYAPWKGTCEICFENKSTQHIRLLSLVHEQLAIFYVFLMCGRNKWTSIDRGYCKRPRARDRIPAWKPCPWATHGQYLDVHPTYSVGDKQSTTKLLLLYIYCIYWHILSVFCFLNLLSVMQPQHIAMHMWPWFPSDLRGVFQWTCGLHWIVHDGITWILPGVVEWLVSGIYPLIYIYISECSWMYP